MYWNAVSIAKSNLYTYCSKQQFSIRKRFKSCQNGPQALGMCFICKLLHNLLEQLEYLICYFYPKYIFQVKVLLLRATGVKLVGVMCLASEGLCLYSIAVSNLTNGWNEEGFPVFTDPRDYHYQKDLCAGTWKSCEDPPRCILDRLSVSSYHCF